MLWFLRPKRRLVWREENDRLKVAYYYEEASGTVRAQIFNEAAAKEPAVYAEIFYSGSAGVMKRRLFTSRWQARAWIERELWKG